ncbi:MAG: MerR family DNA-binding transcriptional regulator [Pseudomonadota bacterium]
MTNQDSTRRFAIGDLASEFNVSTRTLRFYEEKGLLTPERIGGVRYFNAADRVRLRLILRGKRLGLSLEDSAEIIDLYDAPQGGKRQLEALLAKLEERRDWLNRQAQDIAAALADLSAVEQRCRDALEST